MLENTFKRTINIDANNVYGSVMKITYLKKQESIRVIAAVDAKLDLLPFVLYDKQKNMFYSVASEMQQREFQGDLMSFLQVLAKENRVVYQYLKMAQYFIVVDCKCKNKKLLKRPDGTYAAEIGYYVRNNTTKTIDAKEVWSLGKIPLNPAAVSKYNRGLIQNTLDIANAFII